MKDSLLQHLSDAFAFRSEGNAAPTVMQLREALESENLPLFFKLIDSLYAGIPERIFREKTKAAYHAVLYTTLSLLGIQIRCAVGTGEGYADAVIETATHIYALEFKVGHPPEEALKQVRRRRYDAAYQSSSKKVLAVGVCVSREFKGVAGWKTAEWQN